MPSATFFIAGVLVRTSSQAVVTMDSRASSRPTPIVSGSGTVHRDTPEPLPSQTVVTIHSA